MNHKQLVQQMADMKAELDLYQSEMNKLRSQVTTYENVEEAPAPASTSSRRKLLKRMAIAGIGGIGALGLAASVGSNNTVLAETPADNAVEAIGGSGGYGLKASGGLAPLFIGAGSTTGAPVAGAVAHAVGELYASSTGQLYYCVTAGNPGVWRQISGSSTSGSLHLFGSPSRFIDTRTPNVNDPAGPYGNNVTRNYNMTSITGSGSTTIPAGATGVIGNITVVAPGGSGFAAVYSGTYNNTSNINFSSGVTLANSFTSSLTAGGQMSVVVKFPSAPSATANILIDIAGYYL